MLFNTFQNRYIIKGTIETIDPIHIGSSNKSSLNPSDIDMSVLKDNNGNPVIPGSSIKGVVRSNFESIIRGLYPNDKSKVCNVLDDKECCISKDFVNKIKDKNLSMKDFSNKIYNNSCDVCKLFGGMGIAGKIQFKDCQFKGNRPQFEYRDGVAIDRDTGASKNNAKYNFEIIPKGTVFDFEMIAENLDDTQKNQVEFIVSLLQGIKLEDNIVDYISIGGKTTRGLGRIRLIDINREEITIDSLKAQYKL